MSAFCANAIRVAKMAALSFFLLFSLFLFLLLFFFFVFYMITSYSSLLCG